VENLTQSREFDIRYSQVEDGEYLKKWLMSPGMLHHFPMGDEKEVDMMVKNWIGFSRFKCSLTAVFRKQPVGIATLFLMPYLKVVHHSMLYFIVDPEFQGHGIGTALIRNIKHLAKNYFRVEGIHFDVFEDSPALSLLKKNGFHEICRQENFVKEDGTYLARVLVEAKLQG